MICNRCGKNYAEIYYKQTVNGKTVEYALCSHCAEEMKKEGKMGFMVQPSFDDLFFGSEGMLMLNDLLGLNGNTKKNGRAEKKHCTLCASTFEDLVKNGKIGCAECYKTFEEELKGSIEKIHGKAKYVGKRPSRSTSANVTETPPLEKEEPKEDRLKRLRQELDAAIQSQEFEKAAVIRDEIRNIESGEEE